MDVYKWDKYLISTAFEKYFDLLNTDMTSTPTKLPLMVELIDGKDFLVSAIPEGKDDFASYVEVLVSSTDAELYEFLIQKVGILNISGTNQELPDVGEKYDDTIYSLFVDREIHEQILRGENIAHKE